MNHRDRKTSPRTVAPRIVRAVDQVVPPLDPDPAVAASMLADMHAHRQRLMSGAERIVSAEELDASCRAVIATLPR